MRYEKPAGEHYDAENVVEFFDSLSPSVRRGAWAWLTDRSAGWSDPVLWCKLLETPFDDVRMKLVETLRGRARLPGAKGQDLTGLWCSVLLAVHRGGRQKLDVVRQVARAIADDPAANGKLLHVLAVAARSIRGPERRAGLSAIVQVLASRPDLAAATAEVLPELKILPQEAMG